MFFAFKAFFPVHSFTKDRSTEPSSNTPTGKYGKSVDFEYPVWGGSIGDSIERP